jgi:hypothetical protein
MNELSVCSGAAHASYEEYLASGELGRPFKRKDFRACQKALRSLASYFGKNKELFLQSVSESDFESAELSLQGLETWQSVIYYGRSIAFLKAFSTRDRAMASAFLKIRAMRFPGKKTVIWSANGHIAKAKHRHFAVMTSKPMGWHLADVFGKGYVPIGLIGHRVEIDWDGKRGPPATKASDALETILHALGKPCLLIDLQRLHDRGPIMPGRSFEVNFERIKPGEHFRGLVFLDHSPARKPLP